MTREVLLYGQISSWTAEGFIRDVNEIIEKNKGAELCVRVNSNGGDVDYGWGAVCKFAEYPNRKVVKVDGKAQSMGLYFLCYAAHVVGADVSNYLLHRAAYPSWIESNPEYFTADRQATLNDANTKLRAALEAKIDVQKFKALKGFTLDQVFDMKARVEVPLTAEEALEIGLVDEIFKVTPEKSAEIESKMIEITAKHNGFSIAAKTENQPKSHTMTLAELKASHPAVYAEIIEIGTKEGATKERERIEAWVHFREVDKKACDEGIAGGKPMSHIQMMEFFEKKQAKRSVADMEDDSTKDKLATGEAESKEKTPKQKEFEEFVAAATANSQVLSKK